MDDSIEKIPNLDLAHLRFLIAHGPKEQRASYTAQLVEGIKADAMGPFYDTVSQDLGLSVDSALLDKLRQENADALSKLDAKLKDAEENLGETEICDALHARAKYLARIGDKDKALEAYTQALEKTGPLGRKIDIVFGIIRVGFFFRDNDLVSKNIDKVQKLIDEGGDWDRRNRLKVYQGLYLISNRDFKGAVGMVLDTLATFMSTEIMAYRDFVRLAVLTATLTLDRPEYKAKIVNSPEVLEVLHEIPHLSDFVTSYYECKYAQFFVALAAVEDSMKLDSILFPHYRYYVREMRIRVYTQLLESYRSLTVESMANTFGVTEDWIDKDLSHFISLGRVHAVIDKVGGVVVTNRPDAKNAQYQQCIKLGDVLLTRIQKLSRVINI